MQNSSNWNIVILSSWLCIGLHTDNFNWCPLSNTAAEKKKKKIAENRWKQNYDNFKNKNSSSYLFSVADYDYDVFLKVIRCGNNGYNSKSVILNGMNDWIYYKHLSVLVCCVTGFYNRVNNSIYFPFCTNSIKHYNTFVIIKIFVYYSWFCFCATFHYNLLLKP